MKKGIIIAAALGTAATGFLGTAALAQEAPDQQYPSFIQQLATRFNLNIEEVKTFFTEQKQERKANKKEQQQVSFEARLQIAVTNGLLTQEQADAIIQKKIDMQERMESSHEQHQNLTPNERHALHEEMKAELNAWAQANSIDATWLKPAHKPERNKQSNRLNLHLKGFHQFQAAQ